MLTYLSNFFSGEVDSIWPHIILLSVTVLASFAVAAGIVFESPKYSETVHRAATRLVIGGVAVEAVCTIFLFVFDEGISTAQQSKIIALEQRIAPRVLTTAQCQGMVDSLKSFEGKKVRVVTYVADGEGSTLGQMITVCLMAAKMDTESALASLLPWNGFFAGVAISGADIDALRDALSTKAGLVVVPISGTFKGNEYRGPASPETVPAMIVVGVKPTEKPVFK